MRTALLLTLALCSHAGAEPAQLPKKCVAPSPVDVPCTSFAGTYRVKVSPPKAGEQCIVTKPIEAEFSIGKPLKLGLVETDASKLIRKLGWKPRKDDQHKASAAIREGVCCVDVRLTATTGRADDETEHRLIVHLARGATKALGKAQERIMPQGRGDDCQNDLDVEVTLVKPARR